MKKNTKGIIIGVVAMVVVAILLVAVWLTFGPKASAGTKAYEVTVTDNNGEVTTYEGKTDAEYLKELMDELVEEEDFTYEGSESDYGLFIESINGLKADYDTDGAYWSIYVNGEYGQYGADSQPVADGDKFGFVYEIAQ
ncbi:MAG: DUF4430 domain-containing protein [Lachnospiraceae bacterium]|nr:DUF4430 domain-containing protein [Lachnospiraceae bacterium]